MRAAIKSVEDAAPDTRLLLLRQFKALAEQAIVSLDSGIMFMQRSRLEAIRARALAHTAIEIREIELGVKREGEEL